MRRPLWVKLLELYVPVMKKWVGILGCIGSEGKAHYISWGRERAAYTLHIVPSKPPPNITIPQAKPLVS